MLLTCGVEWQRELVRNTERMVMPEICMKEPGRYLGEDASLLQHCRLSLP